MSRDARQTLEPCPACGEEAVSRWRAATPASGSAGARAHHLLRCRSCGCGILDPGEDLRGAALYEGGTYGPARGSVEWLLRGLRAVGDRDRLRLVRVAHAGERALEVGAGRGGLLLRLQGAGADAQGIEPSASAAQVARNRGARVERRSLEQADFPPASMDLVVLWHVLEHLDRPAAALRRIRPWLAPGGRLVVATPDVESLQARIGGDRWFHQDAPRHRILFTARGLSALLRNERYEPVRTRRLMLDQSMLGMWLTLLNRLTAERDVPFRLIKRDLAYARRSDALRDAVVCLIGGPLLLPVAALLELGAALVGRGGCVVVEARAVEAST